MQRKKRLRYSVIYGVVLSLILLTVVSCQKKKEVKEVVSSNTEQDKVYTIQGVITGLDTTEGQVTVRELEYDIDAILRYKATSMITNKFGEEIEGDELEIGQIVEVSYTAGTAEILSMNVPEDAWEYQQVEKFSFNSEQNAMLLAGKKFQYTNQTFYYAGGQMIESMELHNEDVLTVRGIGITVYSVVRTSGHGYIRLKNYDAFMGGMLNLGNSIILPIKENMLITAGEGIYRITLSKSSFTATKTVTVKDGEEVVVDFSDYAQKAHKVGNITFEIEPEGADLYINGTAVDYSSPIALNFGLYTIRVEMTGYTTYTGSLDVQRSSDTIVIDLITETASVAGEDGETDSGDSDNETNSDEETDSDDDATDDDSDNGDSDEGDANADVTKRIDSDHTIKVKAPEGVEVYLDNVYKGLTPCKFTKVIGSQTITLSKEGYETKSYSVDVLDDGKNVVLSFSELVEEEE